VNKKVQKNFVDLGRSDSNATGPNSKKFLRRFFQKAAPFYFIFLERIDIQRIQLMLLAG
jgi:hypothetical protein